MENKKVVLTIDDSPLQLRTYESILGKDYDLRTVSSAGEAVGFLNKNRADIILLDINMPEVNGFEFLEDIRNLVAGVDAPIIVVSGETQDGNMTKAHILGAFDVLVKPVKPEILIKSIEKALSKSKT